MTMQMIQAPDPASATLIEPDRIGPPMAPMAMPKQVLTARPGQLRRALGRIHSLLTLGRQNLHRAD